MQIFSVKAEFVRENSYNLQEKDGIYAEKEKERVKTASDGGSVKNLSFRFSCTLLRFVILSRIEKHSERTRVYDEMLAYR